MTFNVKLHSSVLLCKSPAAGVLAIAVLAIAGIAGIAV